MTKQNNETKLSLTDWGIYIVAFGILLLPFLHYFTIPQYFSIILVIGFFAGMLNRIIRELTHLREDSPRLIKSKRYFTKPNEIGIVYEQDENGKITEFQDGQHY